MPDRRRRRAANRATHVWGCVDARHQSHDLGESRSAGVELSVSHAFATTFAFHEVAGTIRREREFGEDGGDQTIVSGRYTGAYGNGLAFSFLGGIGSKTADRISMRERIAVMPAPFSKPSGPSTRPI